MNDEPFLIVDADELFARTFETRCRPMARSEIATSYAEGLAKVASRPSWRGFVVDAHLRDGSGIELITIALHSHRRTFGAVISSKDDAAVVTAASRLGVMCLQKPVDAAAFRAFSNRLKHHRRSKDWLEIELETLTNHAGLSRREAEILRWVTRGGERDTFIRMSKIGETTFKTHVRHVLDKCGALKLDTLAADLLRRALEAAYASADDASDASSPEDPSQ
jgi:DNA-binding NarL/FixJ family response regulator